MKGCKLLHRERASVLRRSNQRDAPPASAVVLEAPSGTDVAAGAGAGADTEDNSPESVHVESDRARKGSEASKGDEFKAQQDYISF